MAPTPPTSYPDIVGCSPGQEAYLKTAWRRAHEFVWRADKLLDHIAAQPAADRPYLWSLDHENAARSTSPRTWFGPYSDNRRRSISEAVRKAEERFRDKGNVEIKRLRCGQPIAASKNKDTDVCPKGKDGDGPSGYHAPVGTIVTCPQFWERVDDKTVDADARLNKAADTLVHEVFHWLSFNNCPERIIYCVRYVVDYHTDAAGPMPNRKYYGFDNVRMLAEKRQDWAIRNNDSYAYFATAVGSVEPLYIGVWKKGAGETSGGFFVDRTREQLVDLVKSQAALGQYLADVETYVSNGERRFTAVWRNGAGAMPFIEGDRASFLAQWEASRGKAELIDLEVYQVGNKPHYMGVMRQKSFAGSGALYMDLAWPEFQKAWKAVAPGQYMAGMETWIDRATGTRRYAAFGRLKVADGVGAFMRERDWKQIQADETMFEPSMYLVDTERYLDGGEQKFIGIWQTGTSSSRIEARNGTTGFIDRWKELAPSEALVDLEVILQLPLRIK